jgi:hypothetical protein
MDTRTYWKRLRWIVMFTAGCWLFEGGCLGGIQRGIEILMAAEYNSPVMVRDSLVYQILGPGVLAWIGQYT